MQRYTSFFIIIFILVLGVTTSALAFTFTIIDVPGSVNTEASSINDQGQIVGAFSNVQHGFLRNKNGSFTIFDAGEILALNINNQGQIVIDSQDFSGRHAFLRNKDGTLTKITPLGSIQAFAEGINNSGQIVGTFADSSGVDHGFLAVP